MSAGTILTAAGLVAAVAVAAALLWRWGFGAGGAERPGTPREHAAVFDALCRAHGLDAAETRRLRRLAAQAGLAYPGQVFTSPSVWDRLREDPSGSERQRLEEIHGRIFR